MSEYLKGTVLQGIPEENVSALFHDDMKQAYISIIDDNKKYTFKICHGDFTVYLDHRYYSENGKLPKRKEIKDTIAILRGLALFDGELMNPCCRIGSSGDVIELDLCDASRQVIRIDCSGWRIAEPVNHFIRVQAQSPLMHPVCVSGNDHVAIINEFSDLFNLDEQETVLLLGVLVSMLRPKGPYPVLILQGEQGSAKSTTAEAIRNLIDPNRSPLRTLPKSEQDLLVSAQYNHLLMFDNLSGLKDDQSDWICRLSTGGGFSARKLYSDCDEIVLEATKPVVLNGIDDIALRSDLVSRAIVFELKRIREARRLTKSQFDSRFNILKPKLLGLLLNAVSRGLRDYDFVNVITTSRMAETERWVASAGSVFGFNEVTFSDAYKKNQELSVKIGLRSELIVEPLLELMKNPPHGVWEGSAKDLLDAIECKASDKEIHGPKWPKAPNQLSRILNRIAPGLWVHGVDVSHSRSGDGRTIKLINLYRQLEIEKQ